MSQGLVNKKEVWIKKDPRRTGGIGQSGLSCTTCAQCQSVPPAQNAFSSSSLIACVQKHWNYTPHWDYTLHTVAHSPQMNARAGLPLIWLLKGERDMKERQWADRELVVSMLHVQQEPSLWT